jgi:hypothetical protein
VNSLVLALMSFVSIFGGTLIGMALRVVLPDHHLSSESKDSVKLGIGTIATLAALVLGLLISSAKGTFDTMNSELRQTGSKIMQLDSILAQYGTETKEARDSLRTGVVIALKRIWPEEGDSVAVEKVNREGNALQILQEKLLQLSPRSDAQRWLQSRALQLSADISEARSLLVEQLGMSGLPMPFIVMLIFWLTVIFASFGLFAPSNKTVIIIFLICALSVSGSLYMIEELDQPYGGVMKVSSLPLRNALGHLGR